MFGHQNVSSPASGIKHDNLAPENDSWPKQYLKGSVSGSGTGFREYITMDIYWIISLYFREILFCEYENDLKFQNFCLLCSGYTLN